MTDVEQPPQNGIDLSANEEDDNSKARPADIEQDMREMERRKRVEAIMGSKLFREELERIVDTARDSGNAAGILQQLSDIVGVPASRVGSVFKASNCMQPINDIRGVESMGYAKGEKILRCKLAATFRLLDLYGWTQGLGAQITARLKVDQEYFLVNPYGLLYHEITASSLNKVDMQGNIVEQGTTNFGVNKSHFVLHSVLHAARPDIRCAIYIGFSPVVAISSLKTGLLPLTKDACVLGEVTTFSYTGCLLDQEERDKLVRNLGPNSKVMLLTNHGALCCGETIEEAFFAACHIVQACETQLKLLPVGLDNLVLIPEESRKTIYEQSRCPPEDLAKKFAAAVAVADSNKAEEEEKKEAVEPANTKVLGQAPKWRVGGAEFEALMRMLDNAGYRTGYIYRHPLIKSDPPKPKNDVELPPAVSSLGYLLEEEELFRQGIWKKGVMGKGGDRSRWLNSPNVYQKVEVLETGTPDPKKITKWVAEGSPTHSTPVRIDDPLQFVPVNTNPKEFKRLQQQIKDNRRADKISAGPQSHILEGVTWDEANRIKDATVSQAGDHVVLMGAASKGIIQRGFQHNATVYKAPYAKNPFDNVTDDELNEYKRTVERKKKSIHGEYTDTDFSESEALSSLQTSGAQQQTKQNTTTTTTTAAVSQSEPEDISEHQVMRIETQQAPVPSQPEVVLSDATLSFINGERSHTATNRKPPTGRDVILTNYPITQEHSSYNQETIDLTASQSIAITQCQGKVHHHRRRDDAKTPQDHSDEHYFDTIDVDNNQANHFITNLSNTNNSKTLLFNEMQSDALFQRQKRKVHQHIMTPPAKARPLPAQFHTKHYSQNSNLNTPPPPRFPATYKSDFGNTFDRSLYKSPSPPTASKNISMRSKYQDNNLNSLKTAVETSLYYSNTSSFSHRDSLSYYTTSYFNNSQKIGGASLSSPIYDYADSTDFTAFNTEITNPVVRMFKISSNCCTPQICEHILESLEKPSHLHAHYVGANCPLDLIWNIPIRRNYSPCATPPVDVRNTPPRNYANSARKSRSPYRTLSHFGFNSPQREPQPDHKHVLPMESKRYIPLRRSVSYEEIFSSPRYIDLCEHCFEQIVRFKPELMQCRIKLRNLGEYYAPPSTAAATKVQQTSTNADVVVSTGEELVRETNYSPLNEEEDLTDCAANEATCSIFTCQLEPLIEVEERDSFEDRLPAGGLSSITNSTFIDKITRMNYSEISNNFINTPHTVTNSRLSLGDVEEDENPMAIQKDEDLSKELSNLKIDDVNNDQGEREEPFVTITEIWDFENWLGDDTSDEAQDEMKKDLIAPKVCENRQKATTSCETQTDHIVLANKAESNSVSQPHFFENQRSLMNREERTRRKLEFQELWEDHVTYFENREQVMTEVGHSDTESAIDETQHGHTETQDTPPNEMATPTPATSSEENLNEEIFPSVSFILAHKASGQSTTISVQQSKETPDDDDVKSSSSKLTFNISETNSSQENLLCHSYGSTNILANYEDENPRNEEESDLTPTKQSDQTENSKNSTPHNSDLSREHLLFRTFGAKNMAVDLALGGTDGYTNQGIQQFIDDADDDVIDISDDIVEDVDDFKTSCDVLQESQNHGKREIETLTKPLLIRNEIEIREVRVMDNFKLFAGGTKVMQASPYQIHSNSTKEFKRSSQNIQEIDNEKPLIRYKSGILDNYEEENNLKIVQSKLSSTDQGENSNFDEREHETDATLEKSYDQQQNCDHSNLRDNFDDIWGKIDCPPSYRVAENNVNTKSRNFLRAANILQTKSESEVGAGNIIEDILYNFPAKQARKSKSIQNHSKCEGCSEDSPTNRNENSHLTQGAKQKIFQEETILGGVECNKENEAAAAEEQLSSLEREILEKIEFHQLNKTEEIFNKIENTIRNKLTPSKLELLVKEQWLRLCGQDDNSTLYKRMPTDKHVPDFSPEAPNYSRRSRSLTPLNENSSSPPPSKLNKTTTPPMVPHKIRHHSPERTPSPCSSSFKSATAKRRNFILENIRNAAIPRNTPQIKRLQGYTQAIFGKNPFGPRPSTSPNSPSAIKRTPKATLKSPHKNNLIKSCTSSPVGCATNVYTFQSKLVRGSPRFWVSLSQSPARKPKTTPTSATKSNKKGQRKSQAQEKTTPNSSNAVDTNCCDLNDKNSSCTTLDSGLAESNIPSSLSCISSTILATIETQAAAEVATTLDDVSRVDAEMNALGDEIQQIQPRLENYKRKLDDFGDRVAKCARNMDECVATQDEIISDQCDLKERMVLQQYVDDITCRVQTFSLSETED